MRKLTQPGWLEVYFEAAKYVHTWVFSTIETQKQEVMSLFFFGRILKAYRKI